MNYEVGKQYIMQVVGIRKDSAGYDYIALHDDDPNKEYRVYNILKCQYDSLPEQLYVVVKSIDAFGKIKLRQDEEWLNRQHYEEGKLYAFEVTEVKEDYNTAAPYYIIEDDFTSHRYYFKGEQKYQVGDSCILEVAGFLDNGFLKFTEPKRYEEAEIEKAPEPVVDQTEIRLKDAWNNLPVLDIDGEGHKVELKSSIAFPPDGNGVANIDKQLKNILKELTAFMNADGGTLYIGIHDKTKKVVGIADDYAHLNDESEDAYSGQYKQDSDGYELKIRNTMDRLCQSVANSLITISFEKVKNKEYCKIEVRPARRPIFLCGTELYVRQGNRIKLLKRDEITFFITERMTVSIREVLDTEDIELSNHSVDMEEIKQVIQKLMNERRSIPDIPQPKPLNEIDFWVTWYEDGTWKRTRDKIDEANMYIQLPVYKDTKATVLAFCYSNGRVNTVEWSKFRRGANMNILQTKKTWNVDNGNPKNIFLMLPTDYLVGYSVDSDGTTKVKLHSILDYPTNDSSNAKGGPFLPDDCSIKTYTVIGAEHRKMVAHLIVPKKKRSQEAGISLNSVTCKAEIEYLEKVLTQE